ncbi:MAG: hypothetical protein AB1568_13960 [Thermodesulfobacteriota bacterium]
MANLVDQAVRAPAMEEPAGFGDYDYDNDNEKKGGCRPCRWQTDGSDWIASSLRFSQRRGGRDRPGGIASAAWRSSPRYGFTHPVRAAHAILVD